MPDRERRVTNVQVAVTAKHLRTLRMWIIWPI